MNEYVYVGDWGTKLIVNCVSDISAATLRSIELRRPDGSTISLVAVAENATTISAIIPIGVLNMPGQWRINAKIATAIGAWTGRTVYINVHPIFA